MQNFFAVDLVQPLAHLNEELPDFIFTQRPVKLIANVVAEVAAVAELHDDVQLVLLHEGVEVLDDVGVVHFAQDGHFVDSLSAHAHTHFGDVYLLHDVVVLVHFAPHFVDHTEAALAQLAHDFEVL